MSAKAHFQLLYLLSEYFSTSEKNRISLLQIKVFSIGLLAETFSKQWEDCWPNEA